MEQPARGRPLSCDASFCRLCPFEDTPSSVLSGRLSTSFEGVLHPPKRVDFCLRRPPLRRLSSLEIITYVQLHITLLISRTCRSPWHQLDFCNAPAHLLWFSRRTVLCPYRKRRSTMSRYIHFFIVSLSAILSSLLPMDPPLLAQGRPFLEATLLERKHLYLEIPNRSPGPVARCGMQQRDAGESRTVGRGTAHRR